MAVRQNRQHSPADRSSQRRPEPSPGERITEIQILNPFIEKIALDEKLSILDIKARDQRGRQFNVEMQMVGFPALPKRFLYYWSKLYTEQIQAGEDYGTLRPTISICFVDDILFPGIDHWHTRFRLVEESQGIAFTDDLQIHLIELPKFQKQEIELATEEDRWLYFLRHAPEQEGDEQGGWMQGDEIKQAMEELMRMAQIDIEKEIYEGRLKARRDERAKMQGMLELGIQRGEQMGKIEILQSLLGQEVTPRSELEGLSIETLHQRVEELRAQLGR